ncbi:MAG: hypothetical protein QXI35_08415 [Candidatus Nezhaarchaeales archaeon]
MSSEQVADVGHRLKEVVLKKFDPEVIKRKLIKKCSARDDVNDKYGKV